KIVCAVPSVVAIAANVGHDQVEWRDGRQAFAIAGENGHVCRIDRIMAPAVDRANDDDAERYIDARAATAMRPNGPLCWRPAVDASRAHWRTRLRLGLESVCLAAAGLFALAGRGYRAERFARHARVELARAEDRRSALARDQAELRRITQTLARIEAFRGERGRVSSVLGELSEAIPESTAVLTFHVDSVDGSFAAIAAQVADVLPELQGMSEIVAPRIVGSVTREVIGGVRVERASFRFRRPGRRTVSLARAERRAP
ncbi:MAG TPA: hypothetical protein VN706_23695, partial [Gemmatimonadaceae bacterium]|nr:hypothetical protein [Gemmatimonadaceae bacterium]